MLLAFRVTPPMELDPVPVVILLAFSVTPPMELDPVLALIVPMPDMF
jgi:hypothetical protein